MGRTRSVRIAESMEELDELRRYYIGRPEEKRILFLMHLREGNHVRLEDAAKKVGISYRRARRWWDSYRDDGLQGLIERRVWKWDIDMPEEDEEYDLPSADGTPRKRGGIAGTFDFPAFLLEVAGLAEETDAAKWTRGLGDIIAKYVQEIDYVVVSVRHNKELDTRFLKNRNAVASESRSRDGTVQTSAVMTKEFRQGYEKLIDQGQRRGFPFNDYHFPPLGIDLHLERGKRIRTGRDELDTLVGSMLLFRRKQSEPITQETVNFIERLRPFLTFLFTSFIARKHIENPEALTVKRGIERIAEDAKLTDKETQVLQLELYGHTHKQIGEKLYISPRTVQSHSYSILKKIKVRRVTEIFAKFFSARENVPERESDN